MRQLAGTLVLFSLLACAAASETGDGATTTLPEVTVEGAAPAIDLDVPLADVCDEDASCTEEPSAIASTKIAVAAPFHEVRAIGAKTESGGSTRLVVRSDDGWHALPASFLSYFDDDPGCPSIERESAIEEIRVEQGALVVVTASDQEWYSDDASGALELTKARACRLTDGAIDCSEPEVVAAKRTLGDEIESFVTDYRVNADGELEVERPYDEAAWEHPRS